MTHDIKKRWIKVFLVFMTVWPFVHYAMTIAYDVNPWKFMSFGMYTSPQRHPRVHAFETVNGQSIEIDLKTLPISVQFKIHRYEMLRRGFGRLIPPSQIASLILNSRPKMEGVVIVLRRLHLNRRTAIVEPKMDYYEYVRKPEVEGSF